MLEVCDGFCLHREPCAVFVSGAFVMFIILYLVKKIASAIYICYFLDSNVTHSVSSDTVIIILYKNIVKGIKACETCVYLLIQFQLKTRLSHF